MEDRMNKIISFPYLSNYYIPIKYLIEKTTKCKTIIPPPNNKETISLGSRYSPEAICMPFKYNLGNYINVLNSGATILIQAGGGCRYGYFAELQESILKDLGYNFTFVNLIKNNHISLTKMYKFAKNLNHKLNIITYIYYLIQSFLIIIYMDKLDKYLRKNMGYAKKPSLFKSLEKKMHQSYLQQKLSIYKIIKIYHKYKKEYQSIPIKNTTRYKVLLIGELYTLMDSNSSHNLETTLIKEGIEVIRYTNLTYLLLLKKYCRHQLLKKGKKYLKYPLGADGTESVVHALEHAKNGIDGIIHIKSFGCVPEINAMPILNEISEEYRVPIIYLSFSDENNINNLDTKIEAFLDMIKYKKKYK